MSGDHGHDHTAGALRAGARHQGRLAVAFGLVATFFVVEAVAGVWANSLALLSDAGHMLTDVIGLGMALAAIQLANRAEDRRRVSGAEGPHTFGLYRLEILAAFVNALLLFGVAIWVLLEAVRRLGGEPEVLGTPMLVVGALGLAVNVVALALLRRGATESLNVEGAYLEVVADTLGSVGVVVAAIIIQVTGWTRVDALFGAAIGLWILPRTYRLGRQAVRILMQSAPPHIDTARIAADLAAVPGVLDVHDVHVWTLTSEMESASAHLTMAADAELRDVLGPARAVLAERHGIDHATLQVEPAGADCCHELHW